MAIKSLPILFDGETSKSWKMVTVAGLIVIACVCTPRTQAEAFGIFSRRKSGGQTWNLSYDVKKSDVESSKFSPIERDELSSFRLQMN